jgi:hypothetical protein
MTQADSVLSTPPTNTSVTRRSVLGTAAGAAAALAAAGASPMAAAAGATELPPPDGFERVLDHQGRVWFKADGMPDPIYAAIERHKETAAIWDTAVTASSGFNDFDTTDEQRRQRDLVEDAEHAAWQACDQAGIDLVTTEPTTPAGIIAAIRHVQIQIRDDIYMPTSMPDQLSNRVKYEGDSPATLAWVDAYLDSLG